MENLSDFFKGLEDKFYFSKEDSLKFMEDFHREMEAGLKGEESSLKMLPTFVKRPAGSERGLYFAIDLGGSNLRVMAVKLSGMGKIEPVGMMRYPLSKHILSCSANEFFDFMADAVKTFLERFHINKNYTYRAGFTFSFPVVQSSISRGVLVSWTKGFSVSDVEGRDVVELLNMAFKRKGIYFLNIVALINDTVGTLVTKCYEEPTCDLGVILGTGTNAAYPEKIQNIFKLKQKWNHSEMIINIEWGGFDKIKRNIYDITLDDYSENRGQQRLEKMVSGMYLGEIVRLVLIDAKNKGFLKHKNLDNILSAPYTLSSEHLSFIVQNDSDSVSWLKEITIEERKIIKEIIYTVSERSARIAGSAIASVITWMDKNLERTHTVAIDGSLFEKFPKYRDTMEYMIVEIFGESSEKIKITHTGEGSGIGAAIVAATVSY